MVRFSFAVLFGIALGGCAIGNTSRYDLGGAALDVQSKQRVAVATVDARPYVLSGNKPPTFVGLMRGGYGNPFDVATDSGRPLADDVSISIVKALDATGVSASKVIVAPRADIEDARQMLLESVADRYAFLVMRAWKSDTYYNTGLSFDLDLSILGPDGGIAAVERIRGQDDLGSGNPREPIEEAFKRKIEMIFNDPAIKAALE